MIERFVGTITTVPIQASHDACCRGLLRTSALADVSDGSWWVQQSVWPSDEMQGCSSSMPAMLEHEAVCAACIFTEPATDAIICIAPGTQVATADVTTATATHAAKTLRRCSHIRTILCRSGRIRQSRAVTTSNSLGCQLVGAITSTACDRPPSRGLPTTPKNIEHKEEFADRVASVTSRPVGRLGAFSRVCNESGSCRELTHRASRKGQPEGPANIETQISALRGVRLAIRQPATLGKSRAPCNGHQLRSATQVCGGGLGCA
jgi:hypothetical protein